MILLCGIPSEPPLAMVRRELDALGLPHVLFNQRHFTEIDLVFEVRGGRVEGRLVLQGRSYRLEHFTGVYTRLMDDTRLPELKNEPMDSGRRKRCRALHEALIRWYEIAPCRVVNRSAPMASNHSKPYQEQLALGHGFAVPETLITNEPLLVKEFRNKHKTVIYKSISGIRSIVKELKDEDLDRLDCIRWCPTQFQEFVEGYNVRVHVVGDEVLASAIDTNVTDYRYAHRTEDGEMEILPFDLPDDTSAACVALCKTLGLSFAGIDLKLSPDGRVYCFEVNPSPAFSFYERQTQQPIARSVAKYLANGALPEAYDRAPGTP